MIGRKILYALVIGLCGLIALLSLVAIVGGWALEKRAETAAVAALQVVQKSAGVVQQALIRVDQPLALLQSRTSEVADASQQLSQNVTDQGLVRVLLPEERDQQLTAAADSLRDTFTEVRDTISNGLDLYQAIDRLPFLSLPRLNDDQFDKIEGGVAQARSLVDEMNSQVRDVRSGTAGAIDKVTATAEGLSAGTGDVRSRLNETNTKMAALQARAIQLQQAVPTYLMVAAVVLTLLLVFVIFTQVEVVRLYVSRWRKLGS